MTQATQHRFITPTPGINARSLPRVERLIAHAEQWRIAVRTTEQGVRIIDAGIATRGSIEAGLEVARICMADLGTVALRADAAAASGGWPTWIDIHSSQPVLACLASQYAGWSLSASKEEGGGRKFFALGSGPARALAAREPLFEELGYKEHGDQGVLVMEVDREPPQIVIDKVLRDCGLPPQGLTVILTPTASAAGTTQVVARALEVALHKVHVLGFALDAVIEGRATAPLPPPARDAGQAMGRTNDAILYGAQVHLTVDTDDDTARKLAHELPSANSSAHGRPFADIFRDVDYDFYRIDPALFAPAEVWVSSLGSGATFRAGRLDLGLLRAQWLQEAVA